METDNDPVGNTIRWYMRSLRDPMSLIDPQLVSQIDAQLQQESDPLERLKLQAQYRRASSPPLDEIEQEFVTVAKKWAEDNDITEAEFIAEGVPVEVLATAGFDVVVQSKPKRKQVSQQEALKVAKTMDNFTTKELATASGAHPSTAQNLIGTLLDNGNVYIADTGHRGIRFYKWSDNGTQGT